MIKAQINVIECDKCGEIQSVDVLCDEQLDLFESRWDTGPIKDFCENCRHLPEAAEWRATEEQYLTEPKPANAEDLVEKALEIRGLSGIDYAGGIVS